NGNLSKLVIKSRDYPTLPTIPEYQETIHSVRHQCGGLLNVLRSRRIGQIFQVVHEVGAPVGALMGEDVRVVKMEVINDIRVAQGLDEKQFIVGGPVGPCKADGLGRRAVANGHGYV